MWMAKKMLPEYVFDTTQLEGNPMTFPEVQTLLDGITVGGHRISDAQQVLNLKEAWQKAFSYANKSTLIIDKSLYLNVHSSVAKEKLWNGAFYVWIGWHCGNNFLCCSWC